jgi:hypothetical protein
MTSLLEAVRGIVAPKRVVEVPGELTEEAANSKCGPISVRYSGNSWALRLKSGDHLPVLAELPKEQSVRRLPDFLLFIEPPAASHRSGDETLRVLVCEFKSSATGAEAAVAQVRLGMLLAEYLMRIAAHSIGRTKVPDPWCSGLIASPEFPPSMIAKGRLKPGKLPLPSHPDPLTQMEIFQMPGTGELRLENFL